MSIEELGTGWQLLIMVGLLVLVFGLLLLMSWVWVDEGCKQGQIDCLNGKVKYEKQLNDDGETVWMEIKKDLK